MESSTANCVEIGGLKIEVIRTVRVRDGRRPSYLPPNRGAIQMRRVKEFKEKCPEAWDAGGWFLGLHDKEAVWLNFILVGIAPVAVQVGAGGMNAVSGKKLTTDLAAGSYMVVPPQPWIDGWKGTDGEVYQFVATRHMKGAGATVAEQLIGDQSVTGGLGIAVYGATRELALSQETQGTPNHWAVGQYGDLSLSITRDGTSSISEMGLGKGGMIRQKIYPDPHGIDAWSKSPIATTAIYLADAAGFAEITGTELPPSPVTDDAYSGPYYHVDDDGLESTPGAVEFVGLKSVFDVGADG